MMLFLKFGGLTILVAHVLTSRTLSQNPRVHSKETCTHFVSFFSLLFFSFLVQESYLMPLFFLRWSCAHALSYLLFKMMQDRIFAAFLLRERIKISGCSFEFKSNLNSNANQLIPIHSTHEKRWAWALLCMDNFHEKPFLMWKKWHTR